MIRRLTGMALAALLLLSLAVPAAAGYTDVPAGAWYENGASFCREVGWLSGVGNGRFAPGATLNRAMAVTALYRMAGSPATEAEASFADVPSGAWYEKSVAWASGQGIVTGYPDGTFRPERAVSRAELAAFLWRFHGEEEAASAPSFPDAAEIPAYASGAAAWATEKGIIKGKSGRFDPSGRATRAEAAVMLTRCAASGGVYDVMDVACGAGGIAAMADGSFLVTDVYNKVIWRLEDGKAKVYAGTESANDVYGQPLGGYHDDTLLKSLFAHPWAIAPWQDGWAITDTDNGVVRKLTAKGVQTLGSSNGSASTFKSPTGLAAGDAGELYIADTAAGAVYRLTKEGVLSTAASNLNEPMGLCWSGGSLYIAETGANRIVKLTGSTVVTVAGGEDGYADGAAGSARFSLPKGVAVGTDGTIYVADTGNSAVRRIRDGRVDTLLLRDGDELSTAPVSPAGLLVHGGRLYICDTFARRVLVLPVEEAG